ncbi:MAG TPA: cbb3-type cytochrome c oxidase subunit I [Solirubrobacteraceae bacterium]|jgi:heme/copper-type cytochrome/quinol oxidase subunit 1|nr:cbb3-type cytochrome c oxidase subunit I [Solirubrobacteraceae bacterium]
MAACVLATIVRHRAPGMSLLRMPVFTWTGLVSVLMTVGSFPVLILVMVLLYLQRRGANIFIELQRGDRLSGPVLVLRASIPSST